MSRDLLSEIRRIDGKGYRAYKDLKGDFPLEDMHLFIDHVQGDPFAAPSRMRVRIPQKDAAFPEDTYANKVREVALRDFIARRFWDSGRSHARGGMGSGGSGRISVPRPGQEILERSSVSVNREFVEVRFSAGLPADGRRIAGGNAVRLLTEYLPRIARESMLFRSHKEPRLRRHIECAEDAQALRGSLQEKGLVAFIADGSVLPRSSGVDQGPLAAALPFSSPEGLRTSFELPHAGKVEGMGVSAGLTLIIGGGYHGKSTLLEAVKHGVYDHIPGDGRELAVTVPDAVKIRAEDGRRAEKVDISPFIDELPGGVETSAFCSDNASGSTSQAANVVEALEAGSSLLLIDEDSSASNFMTRDLRMQRLVSKDNEPITPFVDRVRPMMESTGCSCVMVLGGSGDFLDLADTVIMMSGYRALEVTEEARTVAAEFPSGREREAPDVFEMPTERVPLAQSLDPSKGGRREKVSARSLDAIDFGKEQIDLSAVEQLVDVSQARALADALVCAWKAMDGDHSIRELADKVLADVEEGGLDRLGELNGDRALFRRQELAAALNRLRTLVVYQRSRSR